MRITDAAMALACLGLLSQAPARSDMLDAMSRKSYELLTRDTSPPPDSLTIRVTALPCGWRYRYVTEVAEFEVAQTAGLEPGEDPGAALEAASRRAVLLPVGKAVRFVITADGEAGIRLFAVPTLGLQTDAIPGRINEIRVTVKQEGIYMGGPATGCDRDPAWFALRAVDPANFGDWAKQRSSAR